jgi:hypothetical protein
MLKRLQHPDVILHAKPADARVSQRGTDNENTSIIEAELGTFNTIDVNQFGSSNENTSTIGILSNSSTFDVAQHGSDNTNVSAIAATSNNSSVIVNQH